MVCPGDRRPESAGDPGAEFDDHPQFGNSFLLPQFGNPEFSDSSWPLVGVWGYTPPEGRGKEL